VSVASRHGPDCSYPWRGGQDLAAHAGLLNPFKGCIFGHIIPRN
jgi:hypothetical protein